MPPRRRSEPDPELPRRRPATTPEARENQLISLAVDLAERQLADGTASSQVLTHYLKLGSSREKLEQERLKMEVDLMEAKREMLASQQRVEELYEGAIRAMRSYSPHQDRSDYEETDYDDSNVY